MVRSLLELGLTWQRGILGGVALTTLVAAAACGTDEAPAVDPPSDVDPNKPPSFDTSDAGKTGDPSDAGKCESLNIGIIGRPGEEQSSNFQQWLANAGTTATRVQEDEEDELTSGVLAPFDVVVLDHLRHDHSEQEAAVFQNWLSSGKGAMSMTGYLNVPEIDHRANPLLAKVGLQYVTPRFDGPVTTFLPHPITQGLTEITFLGGYAIQEVSGSTATRTVVATVAPSRNVGYAAELGQGRAFVWGDEWIQFDSEWTTLPQVQQFWVQIFAWLAPNRCRLAPQPR